MFAFIWMAVVGLIVGILARFLYPGTVPLNWFWSIVLGIAGAWLAGLVTQMLTPSARGKPFHPAGFLMAIVGAMVLIFICKRLGVLL
jgi:uncharacterized membrane protein YeaQ/YmgE (transglycosylase-associated protein family)